MTQADISEMQVTSSTLSDLVRRFRVRWQAWPETIFVGDHKVQNGYSLELYGTDEVGVDHPGPGSDVAKRVYAALRQIARSILPKEQRASRYEITMFDDGLRYSPAHGNRPEVQLAIRILHRGRWDAPTDECEQRCLKEMEDRLITLGAHHG